MAVKVTSFKVNDRGHGNDVNVGNVVHGSATIIIAGNNNAVFIDNVRVRKNLSIHIAGDGNLVRIGKDCILEGSISLKGFCTVRLADAVTSQGFQIFAGEKASIRIGQHCLLSAGTIVRTFDGHSIYDLASGERCNVAADIDIGDHVWVGESARIHRGTVIGRNSVVEAGSIVSNDTFVPNALIGGVPGRLLREGIIWDRWLADRIGDPHGRFDPFFESYL